MTRAALKEGSGVASPRRRSHNDECASPAARRRAQYEGQWKKNVRHGEGTYLSASGTTSIDRSTTLVLRRSAERGGYF
jgi:hypothetical protein